MALDLGLDTPSFDQGPKLDITPPLDQAPQLDKPPPLDQAPQLDKPPPDQAPQLDLSDPDKGTVVSPDGGADLGAPPTGYDDVGSGTAQDPYLLFNGVQWIHLATSSAGWSKCFKLMQDIDLSGIPGAHPPIGSLNEPFTGVMDGNGNVVSGFTNTTGSAHNGLFGCVDGASAVIKNIAVKDAHVSGENPSGALVGQLGQGTVENAASFGVNCIVESAGSAFHKGGLIGRVLAGGVVKNVFSTCRIGGTGIGIGGIIGHNEGSLTNGYYANTTFPIQGANRTGGLIGWNTSTGVVANTFTVADILADTSLSDVALHIGTFQGQVTNSFFDTTRTVTNLGTGGTKSNGIGVSTMANPGYFFKPANAPLSSWDFATVWLARTADYPILKWLAAK